MHTASFWSWHICFQMFAWQDGPHREHPQLHRVQTPGATSPLATCKSEVDDAHASDSLLTKLQCIFDVFAQFLMAVTNCTKARYMEMCKTTKNVKLNGMSNMRPKHVFFCF